MPEINWWRMWADTFIFNRDQPNLRLLHIFCRIILPCHEDWEVMRQKKADNDNVRTQSR